MNEEPRQPDPLPTPQVSDHELVRKVGSGSYGVVWLCRNVMGSFRSAKIIYRQSFDDERPFQREFSGIQRFEPVSRTHPGLVSILQIGIRREEGYFYYVMEAADDVRSGSVIDPETYTPKTLKAVMMERNRLPVEEVVALGISLASALGHLHQHDLLHRDIKPSNVIFVKGQPELADIGLVTSIKEAGSLLGTPGYMAPEGSIGPTCDLFSLGKVLYEISTGRNRHQFPELPTDLLETSEAPQFLRLNRILLRACANDPRARYQSAAEMQEELSKLQARTGRDGTPTRRELPAVTRKPVLTLFWKPGLQPETEIVAALKAELQRQDCELRGADPAVDTIGWVHDLDSHLRDSDAVIVLLSAASVGSEMLAYQLELGRDVARQQNGRPLVLPVRVRWTDPLPPELEPILSPLNQFLWQSAEDNERLAQALVQTVRSGRPFGTSPARLVLEAPGGAVPLDSRYYVVRPTDREFQQAIARRDSVVLVKGARQMGKTSLLARGLQHARETGSRIVLTDFQKLDAHHLASADTLFQQLADFLADQLDLKVLPSQVWDSRRSPNINFERYLRREVLAKAPDHFVWGLDEVDRLFSCSFGSEVFGLFRSWHNERALDPGGPWARLTLAIAYATEAHLFITDINQSPFNVGTRLTLDDFSIEQMADLNRRYGSPIDEQADLPRLFALLGGQPYLVRHAFNELASEKINFQEFMDGADRDEGIFGDHLRRILISLSKDAGLTEVLRGILQHRPCRDLASFYRLRSAGLVKGEGPERVQPRCELYTKYLQRQLL